MNASEQLPTRRERIVLADRGMFTICNTRIEPARRTIEANDIATLEPRVMQVLVALNDARGGVLSRDRLIDRCWAGVIVGEDAVNRAIGELRRAVSKSGADFAVETIPKVGYRLKTSAVERPRFRVGRQTSRRALSAGLLATFASAGLGGVWWARQSAADRRTQVLVNEARPAVRAQLPADNRRAIKLLEEAWKRSPRNAEAAGLLAMAWRDEAEFASSNQVRLAVERADHVARAALAIDPHDGNALTALATLQPYIGDWARSEARLQQILAVAPDTLPALSHLMTLYQSSGYLRRSRQLNDRAIALDPLSPVFQFRRALKEWIYGDIAAADLTIDRVQQIWPRHPAVWNARLMLYAYTGRPEAALTMLNNRSLGPPEPVAKVRELWRISLAAIGGRNPAEIDRAVAANLAALHLSSSQAATAIMTLATLGRVDEAFAVARGYFLGQGSAIARPFAEGEVVLADQLWKRSMMLFTPATLAMRRDRRFGALCTDMGLTRFWQATDRPPDFRAFDRATA